MNAETQRSLNRMFPFDNENVGASNSPRLAEEISVKIHGKKVMVLLLSLIGESEEDKFDC